jgi:UDPglucose 6-dehydrogenase
MERFLQSIRDALWVLAEKRLTVWGLSFKPHTDDVRSSLAVRLVERLVAEGAEVTTYDPHAMEKARQLPVAEQIRFASNPLEAAEGAEALIIATEWPEFADVNFQELRQKMRTPLVFDGRNLLDPRTMERHGFEYRGIGRGLSM